MTSMQSHDGSQQQQQFGPAGMLNRGAPHVRSRRRLSSVSLGGLTEGFELDRLDQSSSNANPNGSLFSQQFDMLLGGNRRLSHMSLGEQSIFGSTPDFDNFKLNTRMTRSGSFCRIDSFFARPSENLQYLVPQVGNEDIVDIPTIVKEEGEDSEDEEGSRNNTTSNNHKGALQFSTPEEEFRKQVMDKHLSEMNRTAHNKRARRESSPATWPLMGSNGLGKVQKYMKSHNGSRIGDPGSTDSNASTTTTDKNNAMLDRNGLMQQALDGLSSGSNYNVGQNGNCAPVTENNINAFMNRHHHAMMTGNKNIYNNMFNNTSNTMMMANSLMMANRSNVNMGSVVPPPPPDGPPPNRRKETKARAKSSKPGNTATLATAVIKKEIERQDRQLELRPTNNDKNSKTGELSLSSNNRPLTSKYKGVCWYKRTQKWVVQIKQQGIRAHVGYFTDELEAAKAYQKAMDAIKNQLGKQEGLTK